MTILIDVCVISLQSFPLSGINGNRMYFGGWWVSKDSFYATWSIGHPTWAQLGLLLLIHTSENLLTILLHTKWSQHFQMDLIRLLIKPLH